MRQVFASFDLQIAYDKAEHLVELTATVSEAVAYPRIVERIRLAA